MCSYVHNYLEVDQHMVAIKLARKSDALARHIAIKKDKNINAFRNSDPKIIADKTIMSLCLYQYFFQVRILKQLKREEHESHFVKT